MKINWNQKYFTIAAYAFGTIVLSAFVIMLIYNHEKVSEKLAFFTAVATPIIIGIFCAYLLNPLMMKIERGMFKKWSSSENDKARGRARVFSLTLTMLTVLLVLALIVILVIPQLITNIAVLFSNMDNYIASAHKFVLKLSDKYPQLAEFLGNPLDDIGNFLTDFWKEHSSDIMGFAGNIASGIWSVLDALKNIFFGLTISVYLLAKKEMFVGQAKKLLFAVTKPELAQRFLKVCRRSSEKFLNSIVGRIIDSFVAALILFFCCLIFGMPYSPLMAMIMFVFNLIPVIGPILGLIPCCFLLIVSGHPIMAIWLVVINGVVGTIDGNFIGPWILGDSTGLPAVWVLISIVIGGGLFGIPGMLLGVPVCAVIYMLIKDIVENKLKRRHLPPDTSQYVGNVDYITSDYVYEASPEAPLESPKESEPPKKSAFSFIKKQKSENKNEKK
ncbi:MAG: AI-2E family transporter [Oscillospiraceae bacterium]|nr:AI-2E family transporter [Oscillospiraceae bacterium]